MVEPAFARTLRVSLSPFFSVYQVSPFLPKALSQPLPPTSMLGLLTFWVSGLNLCAIPIASHSLQALIAFLVFGMSAGLTSENVCGPIFFGLDQVDHRSAAPPA